MSDPISHEALTSDDTAIVADSIYQEVSDVTDDGNPLGTAVALVRAFYDACKALDVDPSAAFNQIADSLEAGLIAPSDDQFTFTI